EHEWIRVDSDGKTATIGVTDFAQHELGDIVFVELKDPGEALNAGDVFGTIEAVKTVSDLFMPVSGTVREGNPDLDSHPEHVNEDPYGKGWMVKIEVSNPEELGQLLSADAYQGIIGT
ncbi:MAG TPA: glycine cleavage system protein GcvH, partial [Rhodothermales bacterium]|nr:glycine cleavage system protein GcvH [Rhodothermales bacterium]